MFRHRQTQVLQRDLEQRFGKLLEPFGIRSSPDQTCKEAKEGAEMPARKPAAEGEKVGAS